VTAEEHAQVGFQVPKKGGQIDDRSVYCTGSESMSVVRGVTSPLIGPLDVVWDLDRF